MLEGIVAVISRQRRVLVIRRGPHVPFAGYWAPLSGRIEAGELQEQALVREVREEVGLAVRPGRKVWECPSSDGLFRLHWWTAHLEDESREVVPDPSEVSAYAWIEPAEFERLGRVIEADAVFFRDVFPTIEPGT